jgi:hypothetical protein
MASEPITVDTLTVRLFAAYEACQAYQRESLKRLRMAPSESEVLGLLTGLRQVIDRHLGLPDDNLGVLLVRERMAAEAYAGLCDLIRQETAQTVRKRGQRQ